MRLLLIRHGETDSNRALALDTAYPGAPLNETGRAQAQALADLLRDEPITAVLTSDLTRAVETGAPLAAAHRITAAHTADLREIQAGDLEMTTDTPSFERFEAIAVQWFRGELDARMPGGETGTETLMRLDRGIGTAVEAAGENGCAAVVAHGAAIRLWTALRTMGPEPVPEMLRNTGVIVVDGSPDAGWRRAGQEPTLV